jgi:hypothetical protein
MVKFDDLKVIGGLCKELNAFKHKYEVEKS